MNRSSDLNWNDSTVSTDNKHACVPFALAVTLIPPSQQGEPSCRRDGSARVCPLAVLEWSEASWTQPCRPADSPGGPPSRTRPAGRVSTA